MTRNLDAGPSAARAHEILLSHQQQIYRRTDRMFAVLMVVQWFVAIAAALWLSPSTWSGTTGSIHPHVWMAVGLGFALCELPVIFAWKRPGQPITRFTIAVAQVMFSSLLIQVTGGRIETHFHIFGSLAFLAAYRDWRVLVPATLVVAADHFIRGVYWPETVFGVLTASPWRWVEHAGWVAFEDVLLLITIRQSVSEMEDLSRQAARLESHHEQLREYSEQVIRSFEKERAIIEGALDAVVEMDAEGKVVAWNNQATATFGWSQLEVFGRKVSELIIPDEPRDARDYGLKEFCESGRAPVVNQRLELQGLRQDGTRFPIELAITPISSGEETMFCAFIRDITARLQYEQDLRQAKEQAEMANRTKSEFLANMSHEIRTPLNGILGFTELLMRNADGGDERQRRDYVDTISTSGKHLLELINDILDLSKIEAGQLQIECADCSPHQIVADVVSVLRVRAQEKGLSLDYRWNSEIPELIQSDSHRLRQLLMNLVGNAIKFTEIGRIDVTLACRRDESSPQLEIEIRDTGIGIPAPKLLDIFKPFVQADNSMTRKYGGTGLGLAISKNIVHALGGDLAVQSTPGRGTVFVAKLPTGDLTGIKMLDRPPAASGGDIVEFHERRANLDGLQILLADDGATNRKLIHLFLARQGAEVTAVDNGELAVAACNWNSFDAVLMDMQMPVMDGYIATRKLRDAGFDRPIIALTAHAMIGDREKCEEAGCSGYVSKPVDMDELVRMLMSATRETRQAVRRGRAQADVPDEKTAKDKAIRSSLPTEDPEIREIVAEFRAGVPDRIQALERALTETDYAEIARLAHGLKGAGGTAGFLCLSTASARLEQCAKQQEARGVAEILNELKRLEQLLDV